MLEEVNPAQLVRSNGEIDASIQLRGANFAPKVEVEAAGSSLKVNSSFAVTLVLDAGEVFRAVGPGEGVLYQSPTELKWRVNATFPVGNYELSIIDPSGRRSGPHGIEVVEASSLIPGDPLVASIEPRCGPFAGGETVTIRGANFYGLRALSFGSVDAVDASIHDASVIIATVPTVLADAAPNTPPSVVDVRLSLDNGNATLSAGFTYVAGASTVTSVFPQSGGPDGGTAVSVWGTSFVDNSVVTFGGVNATIVEGVVDGGTQIKVITPPSPIPLDDAGLVKVAVSVSGRCGTATLDAGYRFAVGAPIVSSMSPTTGPESGGTLVEIVGDLFDESGQTAAYIGPYPLSNITVIDAQRLRGLTPSGSASSGANTVVVITQRGVGQLANAFTYDSRPVIDAVVPNQGPTTGGIPVTVRGQGFGAGTGVTIGAKLVDGLVITLVDAGVYEARGYLPVGNGPGVVNVVAYNQNGTTTATGAFTYVSPPDGGAIPTVSSILPIAGPPTGGTAVSVYGTNFVASTVIEVRGVSLVDAGFVGPAEIRGLTPPSSPGLASVTAYTPNVGGTWDSGVNFTYNKVVSISSVSPTMGPTTGGASVTIDGDGFIYGATRVYFGGVEATSVTYELSNPERKISVEAPPAAGPGPVNVTVVDDYGQAIVANGFTYIDAPTITSLAPSSGTPSGGTFIEIFGTNFVDVSAVSFDNLPAVSFWDAGAASGKLLVVSPAFNDAGSVPVFVTAIGGSVSFSSFTYAGPPVSGPTVSRVEPATGPSVGGTGVRVIGANFEANMEVSFGGALLQNRIFVNSNEIDGITPPHAPGSVAVSVGGGTPLSNAFTYLEPPTISTVVPSSGPETGGTSVTITGTNFTQASTVVVGTQPLINVVVTGTTVITGVTQVHAPMTVDVSVTNINGTATKTSGFTYVVTQPGPATITNVSPAFGAEDGGTWVTVTGSRFDAGTVVLFSGAPMTISGPISPNQVTGFAPRGSGDASVQVDPPLGGTWSPFIYVSPPHIMSIAPDGGPASGGTAVAISGTNFTGASGVSIEGIPLNPFSVVSDTMITATTPALPEGALSVVVTNAQFGPSPETVTFTSLPNFTVSSISPKLASEDGGISVTITGSSFVDAGFITGWGSTTLVSSTTMSIVVPPGQGTKVVSVTMGETRTCPAAADCTFMYMPGPSLTGMTPAVGPTTGGTSVELSGSNLASVTGVTFAGNPTAPPTYDPGTGKVWVTAPAGGAGFATVVLTTPYGTATAPTSFRYALPPTVVSVVNTGVTPVVSEGPAATPASVLVTGTNFVGAASVEFDDAGYLQSVVVVSETAITAVTPVWPSAGYVKATAKAAGGAGSQSNAFYFAVTPAVTLITPDGGPLSGATAVAITGSGFTPNTKIRFGGVADAGLLSPDTSGMPTVISGSSPRASDGGMAVVTATNVAGTSAGGPLFEYISVADDLEIMTVAPGMGTVEGNVPVVLTGRNFTGVTSVLFDGGPVLSFAVVNPNTINVTTASTAFVGRVDVEVCKSVCAGAENYAMLASAFEYIPAVSLTSIYPPVGPTISEKIVATYQHVRVTGANFHQDAGLVVTIGGITLMNQVRVDSTTITGEVPNGPANYTKADVAISSIFTGTKVLDAGYSYWPAKAQFAQLDLKDDVHAFAEHTPTRMWVATGRNGLVLIHPEDGGIIKSYKDLLPSNRIRDVAVWKNGLMHRVVLATEDDGIEVCSVDAETTEIVSCTPYFTGAVSRRVSIHPDGRAFSATNNGFRAVDLNTGTTGCWQRANDGCRGRNNMRGIAVDAVNNTLWLATDCGVWGTALPSPISSCGDEDNPPVVTGAVVTGTWFSPYRAVRVAPGSSYLWSANGSSFFGGLSRCLRTGGTSCTNLLTFSDAPYPSNCRQAQDLAVGTLGFAWVGTLCNNLSAGFGRFNTLLNPMEFDSEWVAGYPDPSKQLRVNGVYVDSREVKWVGGTAARNAGVIRYTEW